MDASCHLIGMWRLFLGHLDIFSTRKQGAENCVCHRATRFPGAQRLDMCGLAQNQRFITEKRDWERLDAAVVRPIVCAIHEEIEAYEIAEKRERANNNGKCNEDDEYSLPSAAVATSPFVRKPQAQAHSECKNEIDHQPKRIAKAVTYRRLQISPGIISGNAELCAI